MEQFNSTATVIVEYTLDSCTVILGKTEHSKFSNCSDINQHYVPNMYWRAAQWCQGILKVAHSTTAVSMHTAHLTLGHNATLNNPNCRCHQDIHGTHDILCQYTVCTYRFRTTQTQSDGSIQWPLDGCIMTAVHSVPDFTYKVILFLQPNCTMIPACRVIFNGSPKVQSMLIS